MTDEIQDTGRASTRVLTSDNSAEFYAQKLNLSAPEPVESEAEGVTEEDPKEPIEPEEPKEKGEKPAKGKNEAIEKRFGELTKARNDAQEEAKRERDAKTTAQREKEALETRLRDLEASTRPKQNVVDIAKPTPDQFTDLGKYSEALEAYAADKAIRDRDAKQAKEQEETRINSVKQAWKERQDAMVESTPDYKLVLANSEARFSDPVRDAIVESEFGPQILYHVAKNPELIEKINGATIVGALRLIGRLEAQFDKAEEPTKVTEKPAPKLSKAPAPISPIQAGSAGVDTHINSDGEFTGTPAEYRALRKAGKIK